MSNEQAMIYARHGNCPISESRQIVIINLKITIHWAWRHSIMEIHENAYRGSFKDYDEPCRNLYAIDIFPNISQNSGNV